MADRRTVGDLEVAVSWDDGTTVWRIHDERWMVPKAVTARQRGADGEPSVTVRFEIIDGAPSARTVQFEAKNRGREIRSGDLDALALPQIAMTAFQAFASRLLPDPEGGLYGLYSEERKWEVEGEVERRRAATRGPSEAELRRVAEIYLAHVDDAPTRAVAALRGYSPRTAHRRVKQAELAGLLPPTTPGRRRRPEGNRG